jgi:hypothetical protein
MKKIVLFSAIFTLFMLFSCKKEDTFAYEVTLSAKKPTIGTTTFSQIIYNDGKQLQTISNSPNDFETTFAVASGFNVNFTVKGTTIVPVGTTATPSPIVSYQLIQIKNKTDRSTLCDGASQSTSGMNGKYSFNINFNKTFDGTGCK